MARGIDLTGRRFGRLVVIAESGRSQKCIAWRCLCDCGGEHVVASTCLRRGTVRSCGCLGRETAVNNGRRTRTHGKTNTKTHRAWISARARCRNQNSSSYENYGGRGITFSDVWDDFNVFFAEMGECPPGRSLDRIDNKKGYEPGNCRWATPTQQTMNRRKQISNSDFDKLVIAARQIAKSVNAFEALVKEIRP